LTTVRTGPKEKSSITMRAIWDLDSKINAIRTSFSAVTGAKLAFYETAELLVDGTWSSWPDLPIRLFTDNQQLLSIAWSRFEDLWIATDLSLPFSVEGSTVRWVRNSIAKLDPVIGKPIGSVMIGRGQMSLGDREIEIWTRLLIEVGNSWMEIFNALDENGYDFHLQPPEGTFLPCIA